MTGAVAATRTARYRRAGLRAFTVRPAEPAAQVLTDLAHQRRMSLTALCSVVLEQYASQHKNELDCPPMAEAS